jgi:hypothetical protein
MSAIPELEQALVDAARRHYRRGPRGAAGRAGRRFARPLRLAAPVLVLAALAVLVLAVARVAAPTREERTAPVPAATPSVSPQAGLDEIRRAFAVFRRPRRASDALPYTSKQRRQIQRRARTSRWPRPLLGQSRLVARSGELRMYAYPATDRAHGLSLCTATFSGRGGGGGGCGPVSTAASESRPMSAWGPPRRGKPGQLEALLRDGIDEVRITLRDGTIFPSAVHDNGLLVSLPSMVTSMSWTGPSGRIHVQQYSDPDPNEKPAARGCPNLEPLPAGAGAQATRAVLAAAPRLYPGTSNPRVLSVRPLRPGDRGGIAYRTCGAQTASRALKVELRVTPKIRSDSLSQGTLLLGQIKGRMTVWQQLH